MEEERNPFPCLRKVFGKAADEFVFAITAAHEPGLAESGDEFLTRFNDLSVYCFNFHTRQLSQTG